MSVARENLRRISLAAIQLVACSRESINGCCVLAPASAASGESLRSEFSSIEFIVLTLEESRDGFVALPSGIVTVAKAVAARACDKHIESECRMQFERRTKRAAGTSSSRRSLHTSVSCTGD